MICHPGRVAQMVEVFHAPEKVVGSNPDQGTNLGGGFSPCRGDNQSMSLSLSFSLSEISDNISLGEDVKKNK